MQAQLDRAAKGASPWLLVVPAALVLLSLAWPQQAANVRTGSAVVLAALAAAVLVLAAVTSSVPLVVEVSVPVVFVIAIVVEIRRR